MATFVLVHGMWAGGWYWQRVRPLLLEAGHQVYAPTLTGLGERVHLARPEINLESHIEDIANVLRYEDLRDVVLVGHSYAGMVIRGVADRVPDRIGRLVYLDAFVPEDGERVLDIWPEAYRPDFKAMTAGFDGWRIPTLDPAEEDPRIVAWEAGRAVPHPIATFRQPISLANPASERLPKVFVHCTEKPAGDAFGRYAEMARTDPNWSYVALDSVHDAMAVEPEKVANALVSLV